MTKSSKRKKSLGLTFSQESPNEDVPKISHSSADEKFPIVGNSITRVEIYCDLWLLLCGSLSLRFQSHNGYGFPGLSTAKTVYHKILSLTEIVAFALSEKKPNGLASETNHVGGSGDGQANKNDPFFIELKRLQHKVLQLRPPYDLNRFYPSLETRLNELKSNFDVILTDYASLKERNTFFSNNAIHAIHDLRMNPDGLSDNEIRTIIKFSLEHFESRGFRVFNKYSSIQPLMRIHIDGLAWFEDGIIIRDKIYDHEKSNRREHDFEMIDRKLKS